MKILFVANEYIGKGKPTTGFPCYLYKVSRALVDQGHQVYILAGGKDNSHKLTNRVEIWNVKHSNIKCKKYYNNILINYLLLSYALNCKLNEIIKEKDIDIIQFTSLGGCGVLYNKKITSVLRLSSYAKTYFSHYKTFDEKTVFIMSLLERIAALKCNAVFAPCNITANAFAHDIKKEVSVIETPFINDCTIYDKFYVEKYLKNKKYVLFFGTLYAEKGILVIAQIIYQFLKKNEQYYFVFVGPSTQINGQDARNLIKNAAYELNDKIIFFGALAHEKLYPIIQNADFVLLPSLMDNFPNACIEAMYFSKIVIGTRGASFEQLISNGENGFLCNINDSIDLLRKMQETVLLDQEKKLSMQKNAHKRIEKLKPETSVKQLIDYYMEVIKMNMK